MFTDFSAPWHHVLQTLCCNLNLQYFPVSWTASTTQKCFELNMQSHQLLRWAAQSYRGRSAGAMTLWPCSAICADTWAQSNTPASALAASPSERPCWASHASTKDGRRKAVRRHSRDWAGTWAGLESGRTVAKPVGEAVQSWFRLRGLLRFTPAL